MPWVGRIKWQITTDDASVTLKRLYPSVDG
jgi:hypothetical protein